MGNGVAHCFSNVGTEALAVRLDSFLVERVIIPAPQHFHRLGPLDRISQEAADLLDHFELDVFHIRGEHGAISGNAHDLRTGVGDLRPNIVPATRRQAAPNRERQRDILVHFPTVFQKLVE